MVERAVQQEVSVGAQPLPAAPLAADGVEAGEPNAQPAGGELVGGNAAVVDYESRDGRVRCQTVRFAGISIGRILQVSATSALERLGNGVSPPRRGIRHPSSTARGLLACSQGTTGFAGSPQFFRLAGACSTTRLWGADQASTPWSACVHRLVAYQFRSAFRFVVLLSLLAPAPRTRSSSGRSIHSRLRPHSPGRTPTRRPYREI